MAAMAKTTEHTFVLPGTSPDRALEILSSEAFEIEQNESQEGNKSCRVVPKSKDDARLTYTLETVEYGRGLTGVDRSKTNETTTEVTWDLNKRESSWVYTGTQPGRVKVWGGTAITPQGDGCKIRSTLNVEIKIPLVGRKIEDAVIKGTDQHWPEFERLVRKHV